MVVDEPIQYNFDGCLFVFGLILSIIFMIALILPAVFLAAPLFYFLSLLP